MVDGSLFARPRTPHKARVFPRLGLVLLLALAACAQEASTQLCAADEEIRETLELAPAKPPSPRSP